MNNFSVFRIRIFVFLILFLGTNIQFLHAQYFGKNKPHYESFNFKVYQTPHFEIYHYLDDDEAILKWAQQAEYWYTVHQAILKDTFKVRNPIILYSNHADFQQTTAIGGSIGIGTGGVTEGLKNRVVMPFTELNEQTDHVLGHELVHAFQYNMLINGDSTSLQSIQYLPLWLVEGMAEYLSLGRVDAHTAMWMRDVVARGEIPSIRDLSNPKFFPYRYGQAFWAFLAGTFGDEIIKPFFITTAQKGLEKAIEETLNMNEKNLSALWKIALEKQFGQYDSSQFAKAPGQKLIDKENGGDINISPVISPDGNYLIFLSEKSLFSVDLFLADARSGKIIRKVASTSREGHVDDFSFLESAGTWSPDSKEFAFVVVSKGRNKLLVKDVATGKTKRELSIPGVESFSNPSWSPDGQYIVLSGLVEGRSDLYLFDLKKKKVSQLTNDIYSDLLPKWSPDGKRIVFSSDRLSHSGGQVNGKWYTSLAVMDVETGEITDYPVFPGADNLNPEFASDGNSLVFISNRDGFRNIYRMDLFSGKVFQLTRLLTGVSGITSLAPALSIAHKNDALVYTFYSDNKYLIYKAKPQAFEAMEVPTNDVNFAAATLPPLIAGEKGLVESNLDRMQEIPDTASAGFVELKYKPKFKLDYIGGNTGVSIGAGNLGGTGLAGGVDMLFSDILGRNQFYAGLVLNGEIQDFGTQLAYINQKHRIGWGLSFSHIPYRSGALSYGGVDTVFNDQGQPFLADVYYQDLQRVFEDKFNVFASYTINRTRRIETGVSFSMYNNSLKRTTSYVVAGREVIRERDNLPAPPGFNLFNVNAAYVGDNSYFGVASPLKGYRYRLGVEQYFGAANFQTILADYRKYFYAKPFSVGFRAMHYGRYGKDSEALAPLFLGNSVWVRGYNISRVFDESDLSVNELLGSKVFVSNFEIRLPFSGPERLSLIKSNALFTEFALFLDGGIAFDNFNEFGSGNGETGLIQRKPIFSTGVSFRLNLFGAMVLEPYYAFPLQKNTRPVFGLNIIPGW